MAVRGRFFRPFVMKLERKRAMNEICPLCNSLKEIEVHCPNCQMPMKDYGKVADYFDQYSAYENIDTLKLVDGDRNSLKNNVCWHIYACSRCLYETTVPVKESNNIIAPDPFH
jgi:hypothetical protein